MAFKTHTEGGSWTGGGTVVQNCNLNERTAITTAFNDKVTRGQPCLTRLGDRARDLSNCLSGKTIPTVEIDCRGPSCTGSVFGTAPLGGNSINMCPPALPPGGTQADTDVTVFHELIHSCGGREVDAWAFENHCYSGHGTFTPSSGTVSGFVGETTDIGGGLRAGTFVVWERSTGRAWVKRETGGSWISGPTITRGAQLTVAWPVV
jgi:hypothetical protein